MASSHPQRHTLYIGTIIDTPSLGKLRIRHDQAVGVDHNGTIRFIEAAARLTTAMSKHGFDMSTTDVYQLDTQGTTFLFPGFIDSHTHASQYPNTGIFGSSTLLSWLETYTFPMESSFSDIARAQRVYNRVVSRTLANGTTCAAYYATLHVPATNLLADICLHKGQRALVGRVCMDRMSPVDYRDESPESAADATRQVMQHCQSIDPEENIVRPAITPRFAPSCTDACMNALGKLKRETGAWCQTHVSENKAELEMVRELFPAARDYVSVYNDAGLLGDRTILAHAIHLSAHEIQMISRSKTHVSHCPASNTAITSGAARVRTLLDSGVNVSLGTDMSGGYSPSLLEMAKQAMCVSRHVAMADGDEHKLSVEEVLYLATVAGAKSVGLNDVVGSFEVGKQFDAQLISLDVVDETGQCSQGAGQSDFFGWESWSDRVAKWVWTGDDRNVCAVWVCGRRVHTIPRFDHAVKEVDNV